MKLFNRTQLIGLLTALLLGVSSHAMAKEVNLAQPDETARFRAVTSDYTVDIYVDKVDGKATKFRARDTAVVDAGDRTMDVRLEYQPASGSSLLLGGLGNLLARAATNKTFRTSMTVTIQAGHEYQLIAQAQDKDMVIVVFDHTDRKEVAGQKFTLRDGKFERVF